MEPIEGRWVRWFPWLSLAAFAILWLARWPSFPLLLDPSYHLFISQQALEAGGPLAYDWWEYAPVGRPHLYPPVLHLILCGLMRLGCPPFVAIRLISALVVPLVLVSLYLVMRRLLGFRVALASLWMALVPFSWIVYLTGALASPLALTELLWLIVAVETRRVVAAGLLLGLMFYTHLGLPWVTLAFLAAYALLKPGIRRTLLKSCWGLVLAVPWFVHVARWSAYLQSTKRYGEQPLELSAAVFLLALIGAWRIWRSAQGPRWMVALWLGFLLMAQQFTFRWLSGEGLLPVVLLAGFGVEGLASRWTTSRGARRYASLALAGLTGLTMLIPTLPLGKDGRFAWIDATPFHLLNVPGIRPHPLEVSLDVSLTEAAAQRLARMTGPREILWSNAPYALGLLAVHARRATSLAMFYEVTPGAKDFDPVAAAHVIVWFKITPLPGQPSLRELLRRYPLKLVAEDELMLVFRNPLARELAHNPEAVIPFWLAFVVLCLVLGVVIGEFFRRPHLREDHG